MLAFNRRTRTYVCKDPIDMRQSYDGLFQRAKEVLKKDPFSGHLFVFVNRRRSSCKCLDGVGHYFKTPGTWFIHPDQSPVSSRGGVNPSGVFPVFRGGKSRASFCRQSCGGEKTTPSKELRLTTCLPSFFITSFGNEKFGMGPDAGQCHTVSVSKKAAKNGVGR